MWNGLKKVTNYRTQSPQAANNKGLADDLNVLLQIQKGPLYFPHLPTPTQNYLIHPIPCPGEPQNRTNSDCNGQLGTAEKNNCQHPTHSRGLVWIAHTLPTTFSSDSLQASATEPYTPKPETFKQPLPSCH